MRAAALLELCADDRARFDCEAKGIAALDHPHICTLYEPQRADGRLVPEIPVPLFHINVPLNTGLFGYDYDPATDGQRFMVNDPAAAGEAPPLTVILNWTELLENPR